MFMSKYRVITYHSASISSHLCFGFCVWLSVNFSTEFSLIQRYKSGFVFTKCVSVNPVTVISFVIFLFFLFSVSDPRAEEKIKQKKWWSSLGPPPDGKSVRSLKTYTTQKSQTLFFRLRFFLCFRGSKWEVTLMCWIFLSQFSTVSQRRKFVLCFKGR